MLIVIAPEEDLAEAERKYSENATGVMLTVENVDPEVVSELLPGEICEIITKEASETAKIRYGVVHSIHIDPSGNTEVQFQL